MPKQKPKTNKGKRYEKPVSLYPLPFDDAVRALLSVPQPKKKQKKRGKKNE